MTDMETQKFEVPEEKDNMRQILRSVFNALNTISGAGFFRIPAASFSPSATSITPSK